MALFVVFGNGAQSTIAQRPAGRRSEKEPDIPVIQSDDYRARNQHGDAYLDPDKMPKKPAARSTIKVEEVFDEDPTTPVHRHKRIKQEREDDDGDDDGGGYGGSAMPQRRHFAAPLLAIEPKPEGYGQIKMESINDDEDLVSAPPQNDYHVEDDDDGDIDDDGDDDDDGGGERVVDSSALVRYADPIEPRTPPRDDRLPSASRSTHYDRGNDRAPPSPPPGVPGAMPYHQAPENRGGLFGDGIELDAPYFRDDGHDEQEYAEDPQWCPACDAARQDLSKRCQRHGARLLPRPVPRSDPWKMTTALHGGICSANLCVFCTDIDITAGRPIETEVNDMIVRTPEVLKLSGIAAAALFLARTWQGICTKYQALIPAEKRNLYIQMNGPSILWHLAEHASIAEIFLPIDAIELRAYSRRVRDVDVPGGVGVDENSVNEAAGLSHDGLKKLKLIEGVSRQTRFTMPSKTNFTYNRMPQPAEAQYRQQMRRLKMGEHLQ